MTEASTVTAQEESGDTLDDWKLAATAEAGVRRRVMDEMHELRVAVKTENVDTLTHEQALQRLADINKLATTIV